MCTIDQLQQCPFSRAELCDIRAPRVLVALTPQPRMNSPRELKFVGLFNLTNCVSSKTPPKRLWVPSGHIHPYHMRSQSPGSPCIRSRTVRSSPSSLDFPILEGSALVPVPLLDSHCKMSWLRSLRLRRESQETLRSCPHLPASNSTSSGSRTQPVYNHHFGISVATGGPTEDKAHPGKPSAPTEGTGIFF